MDDFVVELEQKNIHVTREDIDDIVTTALEGGINDWCGKVKVVGNYLAEYASEQISRGGTLKLYDDEGCKYYDLTRDDLLNGIKKYCEDNEKPYDIVYSREGADSAYGLDSCMVDAVVSDMIIQYAVFGEIIY